VLKEEERDGTNDINEMSLDPSNWDRFRKLSHSMLDDMIDNLQNIRHTKIWQPMDEQSKKTFQVAAPMEPQTQESIYEEFKTHILPYPLGNTHPRFWGWVIGTGTPYGMMAELLAAAMNPNQGGGEHAANHVENQVIEWFKEIFNFPEEASGIVVSGGSMANFVGLAVARNVKVKDVRGQGLYQAGKQYTLYGSVEMHSSIDKAVELLGFGDIALRRIPVNEKYEIDISALEKQIDRDKLNGFVPISIIGNAGTVNTGAIDDLTRLADISEKENLWFHVDGAFGSMAKLTQNYTSYVHGMERADSLAFDLHKWLYVQYEAGMVLVRKRLDHYQTFVHSAEYLQRGTRGAHGGNYWFNDYGLQLSRGFKALKIWMVMKEHGFGKYGKLVQQNIQQAQYLKNLINTTPELEMTAPAPLNIVCYRYIGNLGDNNIVNELNKELLILLHEKAIAVPSFTTLNGIYTIRVAITNHRSIRSDFDLLVKSSVQIGREIENKFNK
jgi:glutamate/tyrosine decarboxylase-like PLP-dependent enzyme